MYNMTHVFPFSIHWRMSMDDHIVTVRPEKMSDSKQKLPTFVGISDRSCGAKYLSMKMVIIPPGARSEPHVHKGFEAAIYVMKGQVETRYGKNLNNIIVNETGDFMLIPADVPHQTRNLSLTEPVIAIVAGSRPNEQENVQLYLKEQAMAETNTQNTAASE